MRTFIFGLLAGLAFLTIPADAKAFYPPGFYAYKNYAVPSPYNPYLPTVGSYNSYTTPFSYSFYNSGVTPTPFGYQPYQTYGTRLRPLYTGPYHSVYFNPYTNGYQVGPGTLNGALYGY